MTKTLSPAARRAIKKYGEETCRVAYQKHREGYGASGVAFNYGPPNVRAAEAAINAGRELAGGAA